MGEPCQVLALVWALAWVLFAASVNTTLAADFLTNAATQRRKSGADRGLWGAFAIGFGDNFVTHDAVSSKAEKRVKKSG